MPWGYQPTIFYPKPVMTLRYKGMPKVMLNGKVTPNAMGRYRLGFALGAAILIAAGTAM